MAPRRQLQNAETGAVVPVTKLSRKSPERGKMAGIMEMAVTINHELNSPLMIILGNVELLLRDTGKLDQSLARKLKSIERSAKRIQFVTARLLRMTRNDSVEYAAGVKMLDISEDN